MVITTRNRNLGFAFSTQPSPNGAWYVKPTRPDPEFTGGPASIRAGIDYQNKAAYKQSVNRMFVGGRAIAEKPSEVLYLLSYRKSVVVTFIDDEPEAHLEDS